MLRTESIRQSLLHARSFVPVAFDDDNVSSPAANSVVHDISAMSASDIANVATSSDEPSFMVLPQAAAARAVFAVNKINVDFAAEDDEARSDDKGMYGLHTHNAIFCVFPSPV